jgi:Spy/CpxP family protein refolding chaperone
MKLAFSRHALVVAGLIAALAGTLTLSAYAQPAHAARHADGPGLFMGGAHGPHMGRMLDHMLDSVNATEQQRTQVKDIMKAAAADLKAQRQANRGLRQQMMQAFTQPTVDANTVEALRQKQLAAHDQMSKRMTQAMLDVSRVLTPEQRKALADKMSKRHEMMQRHMREMQ